MCPITTKIEGHPVTSHTGTPGEHPCPLSFSWFLGWHLGASWAGSVSPLLGAGTNQIMDSVPGSLGRLREVEGAHLRPAHPAQVEALSS